MSPMAKPSARPAAAPATPPQQPQHGDRRADLCHRLGRLPRVQVAAPQRGTPATLRKECHVDPLPGRATADRQEAGVTGDRVALGSRYERRPRSGPGRGSGLVLRLSDGALDIAQALLGAALDLPTLAADLLLLAPGHLAEPFLDFAPGLAQR